MEPVPAKENNGDYPLHLAAIFGNAAAVAELVNERAVAARSALGDTPLHLFAQTQHGGAEVLELLLRGGADLEARSAFRAFLALFIAYLGEHLARAFPDHTVLRLATDFDGSTPLMRAAMGAEGATVRLLLDRDADPGRRNAAGRTALDVARRWGNVEAARLLEGRRSAVSADALPPKAATPRARGPMSRGCRVASHVVAWTLGIILGLPALAVYVPSRFWWQVLSELGAPRWLLVVSSALWSGPVVLPVVALAVAPSTTSAMVGSLFGVLTCFVAVVALWLKTAGRKECCDMAAVELPGEKWVYGAGTCAERWLVPLLEWYQFASLASAACIPYTEGERNVVDAIFPLARLEVPYEVKFFGGLGATAAAIALWLGMVVAYVLLSFGGYDLVKVVEMVVEVAFNIAFLTIFEALLGGALCVDGCLVADDGVACWRGYHAVIGPVALFLLATYVPSGLAASVELACEKVRGLQGQAAAVVARNPSYVVAERLVKIFVAIAAGSPAAQADGAVMACALVAGSGALVACNGLLWKSNHAGTNQDCMLLALSTFVVSVAALAASLVGSRGFPAAVVVLAVGHVGILALALGQRLWATSLAVHSKEFRASAVLPVKLHQDGAEE